MKRAPSSRFFWVLVGGLFVSATVLPAAPILNGAFDISGTITVVDSSSITWTLPPPNKALIGSTSGSFAGLTGTNVTINNLTNPPAVVDGAGFPDEEFISFDADPTLPTLLINFIFQGVNPSAACGAPPAVGQLCALPNSPFDFQNTAGGGSRAGFVFSGVTSDGLSHWTGNFTSQFSVPYQTIFAQLATNGSVTNTYSATFTVTSIPEPNTVLFVIGALGIFIGYRRKRRTV
ncbi:MAG TPA: hypothetical protein VG675_18120 [Bryobacteraceae bacterium]|nr:hypothetical protein [Bryobacteraceae bacterium]